MAGNSSLMILNFRLHGVEARIGGECGGGDLIVERLALYRIIELGWRGASRCGTGGNSIKRHGISTWINFRTWYSRTEVDGGGKVGVVDQTFECDVLLRNSTLVMMAALGW
jgi:hypothetical protein